MNVQNFIGGEFVDAVDHTTLENLAPATGQLIGTIPRSKQPDVYRAVAAARVAQHAHPSFCSGTRSGCG